MSTGIVARTTCLIALGLLTGGCFAMRPGYERASNTAAGMGNYRAEAAKSRAQVDTVLEALDGVGKNIGTNPRVAFEQFAHEVDVAEQQARATSAAGRHMHSYGDAFFQAWDREIASIQGEGVRERATKRRGALQSEYAQIHALRDRAEASNNQFVRDLRDLVIYLQADLTPKGVAEAADLGSRIKKDGHAVQKEFDKVLAAVDDVERELVPVPPPETSTPENTQTPAKK